MTSTILNVTFMVFSLAACASQPARSPSATSSGKLYQSEAITSLGLFSKSIEGPGVDSDGNLYVTNFAKKGTIGIVRPGQEPELWLELPTDAVGNSIRFNRNGEMLVADYKGHRVFHIDLKTKELSVYLTNNEMNQPNDFSVTAAGALFLSDPTWSSKKKGNLWYVDPSGKISKIATDIKAANGIDINLEESKLYYGESISGQIYSYDVSGGNLTNRKEFYKFESDSIDGLRLDAEGNIYVARITQGRIDCLSPDGKMFRTINTIGKEPTSIAFGGTDGKTVYVTMRDGGYIEAFQVEIPGREWMLLHSN